MKQNPAIPELDDNDDKSGGSFSEVSPETVMDTNAKDMANKQVYETNSIAEQVSTDMLNDQVKESEANMAGDGKTASIPEDQASQRFRFMQKNKDRLKG